MINRKPAPLSFPVARLMRKNNTYFCRLSFASSYGGKIDVLKNAGNCLLIAECRMRKAFLPFSPLSPWQPSVLRAGSKRGVERKGGTTTLAEALEDLPSLLWGKRGHVFCFFDFLFPHARGAKGRPVSLFISGLIPTCGGKLVVVRGLAFFSF